MTTAQANLRLRENLVSLRSESLKIVALFSGLGGYVWLIVLLWPQVGGLAHALAWAGSIALVGSAMLSYLMRDRHLHSAVHLLVWGTLIAIGCGVLGYHSLEATYLFILPILLAGVLLGQVTMVLGTAAAFLFTFTVGTRRMGLPWHSTDVALPLVTIVLSTVASWLSTRNLYTALDWVWSGYEQARQNEEVARDRRAELRRALKALDEATYRLERANYMLALVRDQAEEARRLKQQFAQTISHELRTPLNLIVGFTEAMIQSPEYYGSQLPATYVRDLSIVYRNANHLQSLINDVLDLSRIEAAQMSLLPEETDPARLIQDAVETARGLVEARGLTLHTKVQDGLPTLWVDPVRIRQVLLNLLNNAARFTERGGVTVSAHRQEEMVVLSVSDTGVGIAEEDLPRIFREFQQLDGTTRRRHKGAGLGLAISQNVSS